MRTVLRGGWAVGRDRTLRRPAAPMDGAPAASSRRSGSRGPTSKSCAPADQPQANRELEALKARVRVNRAADGRQAGDASRRQRLLKPLVRTAWPRPEIDRAEAAVRAELGSKVAKAEAATSQLREELERAQQDAAEANVLRRRS